MKLTTSFGIFLAVLANIKTSKIENLYTLGDSISDSGGLVELTGKKELIEYFYPNDRFTNNMTWVEFLRDEWKVKEFKNYAIGGATSNSKYVSKSLLGSDIPGCIQQAKELITKIKSGNIKQEATMVTIGFFGNDFFDLKATPEGYMKNVNDCVAMVAKTNLVGTIIIPTSTGIIYSSISKSNPKEKQRLVKIEDTVSKLWPQQIKKLNNLFPNINFYELDLKGIIKEAIRVGISLEPCNNFFFFPTRSRAPRGCDDPEKRVYFDQIHPSSYIHERMAKKVIQIIQ